VCARRAVRRLQLDLHATIVARAAVSGSGESYGAAAATAAGGSRRRSGSEW
jgi:hypothetical protein